MNSWKTSTAVMVTVWIIAIFVTLVVVAFIGLLMRTYFESDIAGVIAALLTALVFSYPFVAEKWERKDKCNRGTGG